MAIRSEFRMWRRLETMTTEKTHLTLINVEKPTASAVDTTVSPCNIFDNQMRACSVSDNFIFKNAEMCYVMLIYTDNYTFNFT